MSIIFGAINTSLSSLTVKVYLSWLILYHYLSINSIDKTVNVLRGAIVIDNITCIHCGHSNYYNNYTCENCGSMLRDFSFNTPKPYKVAADEDAFIYTNLAYYDKAFGEMRSKNTSVNWNFAAFFLSGYWLFYRRLYGWGAFFLVLSRVSSLLFLVASILMGVYGNSLYRKQIESNVTEWKLLSEPDKTNYLNKHKGTSVLAVVLIVIAHILLSWIIASIEYAYRYY